jgi:Ca-activated chloride channel family protein
MNACTTMTNDELARATERDDDAGFGCLSTDRGRLPLTAMDVKSRIAGLVSHVALSQTFANAFDEPIEATYIMPLPSRGAVTRFRMEVNGRVIDGEIQERGAARDQYDRAIADGHRAAITEEERPGVFTVRVGNLMPGERATIDLAITAPLPYVDGEATFRFPLVVAPRYIPGVALPDGNVGDGVANDTDAVPDASRISPPVLLPGFPNPIALSLSVEVDPLGLPLSNLRSSLHAAVESGEGRTRTVSLVPGERLDRDFILRYQLGEDAVGMSLAVTDDTFELTLVPPVSLSRAQRPRDVVFVLDRSGSMDGWKIIAARRATARMLDTLGPRDRFGVLAFDHIIDTPPDLDARALTPATDRNRFRAVEFLAGLDARGGTEMAAPLDRAAGLLAGGYADRDRVLVLVTDGQVGNEDQILRSLGKQIKNVRVFTLGIDRAVNEGFLRRLAALGGGAFELVESEDRLDEVMDRTHRCIATPALTEVAIEDGGLAIRPDSIAPHRIPDLFAGAPLVVRGRCEGGARGAITVRAVTADGTAWSQTVTAQPTDNAAIGALWARAAIRELEDQFVLGRGDRAALERRIVDTSIRFRVLSRFTAFVAVDRSEKVNVGGNLHRVTQAVEAPSGWPMAQSCPKPAPGMAPMRAVACASPEMMGAGGLPLAPAAPKSRRSRNTGAMGALRNMLSRGRAEQLDELAHEVDADAADAPEPIDLTPYRRRARALLAGPAAQSAGLFANELAQLVQHLESIGAGDDVIEPLRGALDALRADPATLAEARHVVQAFADDTPPPPRSRRAFWK